MKKKQRAFLKWAGGKYSLVETINPHLPDSRKLIEPFVGAGSIFLNTDYEKYLLNDINQDLINLYNTLKKKPKTFIADARKLFVQKNNQASAYYGLREEFNHSTDAYLRSLIFLYMNRHGYNGLCRYNRSGGFNVPFGDYKQPYFPEDELWFFAEKSKKAKFICRSYTEAFRRARKGDVIYCDPPYYPLSKTASFTSYAAQGFAEGDQVHLVVVTEKARNRGVHVVLSNHNTDETQVLYRGADLLKEFQVTRSISQNGAKRHKASEILAVYKNKG
jgi:DNA adenine methylase